MAVVPAGMHDTDFLAIKRRAFLRSERQINLFGDRKRIHICPQGNHRPRLPRIQQRYHAGMRDPGLDLQPERTQVFRNDAGGADFPVGQLWMPVKIPATADEPGFERRRRGIDLCTCPSVPPAVNASKNACIMSSAVPALAQLCTLRKVRTISALPGGATCKAPGDSTESFTLPYRSGPSASMPR